MTILGLLLLALAAIGIAADKLNDGPDRAPQGESHAMDAVLFALCLLSVLGAHARKRDADDE